MKDRVCNREARGGVEICDWLVGWLVCLFVSVVRVR